MVPANDEKLESRPIFTRFDTIQERDRRTDRQKNGHDTARRHNGVGRTLQKVARQKSAVRGTMHRLPAPGRSRRCSGTTELGHYPRSR